MTERKVIDVKNDNGSEDETQADTERTNTTGPRKLVRRLHHASDGGAFPVSLTSDAAEAIEQLLDVLAGATAIAHIAGLEHRASRITLALNRMYITSRPERSMKRGLDDLTEAEISRLRLLNQKLIEVEQWIRERRDQCLSDYFRAGGVKDHRYSDALRENVKLTLRSPAFSVRITPISMRTTTTLLLSFTGTSRTISESSSAKTGTNSSSGRGTVYRTTTTAGSSTTCLATSCATNGTGFSISVVSGSTYILFSSGKFTGDSPRRCFKCHTSQGKP